MRSAYGYAPRGERCVEVVPLRTGKRVNLLGWMSATCGRVRAHEGSVTAEVFETFIAESLVPCLEVGDVVIWDNARIHRPEAIALIEAVGARVLPQPPYSPDLNAIEEMWSKVKAIVKRKLADTRDARLLALNEAVTAVTPNGAVGWITHCGYLWLPE